jgi:hypothetical protein
VANIFPYKYAASTQYYKGGAAGLVIGTGTVVPFRINTAEQIFVGTFTETILTNANGGAGTTGAQRYAKIDARGVRQFNTTGTTIDMTKIGRNVYFADDNTVTLTASAFNYSGIVAYIDQLNPTGGLGGGYAWIYIDPAVRTVTPRNAPIIQLTGTADAILAGTSATVFINSTAADTITFGTNTTGVDDGTTIDFYSSAAHAHVLNIGTGTLLPAGSTGALTFAAAAGASCRITAQSGKWVTGWLNGVTAS